MESKIVLAMCVMIAVAAAVPAGPGAWAPPAPWAPGTGAANPFIPPWIASAPWFPQWAPCTTIGASCLDCNTKLVCTKVGGLQRPCTDPTLPYCNLGQCSATPTAECAPVEATTLQAVPAVAAAV